MIARIEIAQRLTVLKQQMDDLRKFYEARDRSNESGSEANVRRADETLAVVKGSEAKNYV